MRNHRYWPLLATTFLVAIGIAACTSSGPSASVALATVELSANPTATPTMTLTERDDGALQISLHMSRNGSQQSGTLTLTQVGIATDVAIRLAPVPMVGQPVTLRRGTCENPVGYIRDLDPVVGGIMNQRLEDMPIGRFAMGDLTVVVGPSYGSLGAVSACAEIPRLERPDLPGFRTQP